jgi:hypothetical protein
MVSGLCPDEIFAKRVRITSRVFSVLTVSRLRLRKRGAFSSAWGAESR